MRRLFILGLVFILFCSISGGNVILADAEDYKDVSRLGHLKSTATIFEELGDQSTKLKTSDYTNAVYYIKRQATYNGSQYYLISEKPSKTKGIVGWVKKSELVTYSHKTVDSNSKVLYFSGEGSAYKKAWGGNKDLVYEDMNSHEGKQFNVNLTETVGNNTWYRGKYQGENIWLHESYLLDVNDEYTSRLGHLRADAEIKTFLTSDASYNTSLFTHSVYYIKRQAKYDGDLYYLISTQPSSTNGIIGWVKSGDMVTYSHKTVDDDSKTFYFNGKGSAYDKAWGGKKDLVYGDLMDHKGKRFDVNLTETVGNNTWYRGSYNGRTVWVHESFVTTKEKSSTSRLGHLSGSADIYQTLEVESTKLDTSDYTHAVYYIKEQAEFDHQIYYLISTRPSSTKGTVGWVEASDMQTYSHKTVDNDSKRFYFNGKGSAYNKAWGGKENLVYSDMGSHSGDTFNVNLTERVGNNIWYRGNYDGNTVWVHENFVGDNPVKETSYNLSYSRMLDIQMNQGNPKYDGAGKVNADRANVSYYLNPSNFPKGTSGYLQFLQLDETTNLSGSELNNSFLDGAGPLQGTGSAFKEAGDEYDVNELYLIAHALHETGHGTSTLARGIGVDSSGDIVRENGNVVRDENHSDVDEVVYNMFGYGAYDDQPIVGGVNYAYERKWFSPSAAVVGGAGQIDDNFIERGQNTLYKMKWDPEYAASNNSLGRQYATHVRWAEIQANWLYRMLGDNINEYAFSYDVPSYNNQPGPDGSAPPPPEEDEEAPKDYLVQSYPSNVVGEVDVTSGNLNFRKGPSTDYDRINGISKGTVIDVLGDNGGNWLFIEYNGDRGWVSKDYIDILNLYVVDSSNGITYRDAPAGNDSGAIPDKKFVVLSLNSNDNIVSKDAKLGGTNYTWYRIYRNGNEYWTANNWLTKIE